MKTLFSKQIQSTDRKWYVVDAQGQTLGRISTQIAKKLSGRDRVDYTPHVDNGDYIIVINADKIAVTGNKEAVKMYRRHSQYMGGLKEATLSHVRKHNPIHIIEHAVSGMLPRTKLRDGMMKRLKAVAGSEHQFTAQQPTSISL